jgi:hypothetical protein
MKQIPTKQVPLRQIQPTPILPPQLYAYRKRGTPIIKANSDSWVWKPIINVPSEGETNVWQPAPVKSLRSGFTQVVFSFNPKNTRKQKTAGKTKKYVTKKRKVVKKRS